MTDHSVSVRMPGHGHGTMRAAIYISALRTGHHFVGAPSIQKQNGLFTAFDSLENSLLQRSTEIGRVSLQELLFHIDDPDCRKRFLIIPVHKMVISVFPALRKKTGRHIRCGRAEEQKSIFLHATISGNLSRIISGNGFRTITVLLFLVYNDQAEIRNRRKDRTPGSDYQMCLPAIDPLPLVVSLS